MCMQFKCSLTHMLQVRRESDRERLVGGCHQTHWHSSLSWRSRRTSELRNENVNECYWRRSYRREGVNKRGSMKSACNPCSWGLCSNFFPLRYLPLRRQQTFYNPICLLPSIPRAILLHDFHHHQKTRHASMQ